MTARIFAAGTLLTSLVLTTYFLAGATADHRLNVRASHSATPSIVIDNEGCDGKGWILRRIGSVGNQAIVTLEASETMGTARCSAIYTDPDEKAVPLEQTDRTAHLFLRTGVVPLYLGFVRE